MPFESVGSVVFLGKPSRIGLHLWGPQAILSLGGEHHGNSLNQTHAEDQPLARELGKAMDPMVTG